MSDPPFATEVRIGDLSLEPGDKITYLYDFGDNWEFQVELEEINPSDTAVKEPKILKVYGEAPQQYWNDEDEWDEEDGE